MIKIVLIVILSSVVLYFLKSVNSELFVPALLASGIVLIYVSLSYVNKTFSFINEIIELSGVDKQIYKIIFKIVGISYLIEFGASAVEDIGYKSISDKLIMIGKLSILVVSLPIFYAVINLVLNLLK